MRSRPGAGIVAGLVAGMVWGVMLMTMQTPQLSGDQVSMMTTIAHAVRSDSLIVAWIAHLIVSVVLGAVFGLLLGGRREHGETVALGFLFGIVVWVGGWMIAMPLLLGQPILGILRDLHSLPLAVGSLLGHVIFGALLGGGVALLRRQPSDAEAVVPARDEVRRAA